MQRGQTVGKDGHAQAEVIECEVRENAEEGWRHIVNVAGRRQREGWKDDEERYGDAHRRKVDAFENSMGYLEKIRTSYSV